MRFAEPLWMALFLPFLQGGPDHEPLAPPAGCDDLLAFVAAYVERNYAGFPDKVPDARRSGYAAHLAGLGARAEALPPRAECHALLLEYRTRTSASRINRPRLRRLGATTRSGPASPTARLGGRRRRKCGSTWTGPRMA